MGKGTIASGGTDGLYQVTLDYGQAARDARVKKITADLAALVGKIAEAQALYDAQQATEDAQTVVVNAAINTYITVSNAVGPALEAVNAAQAALAELQADAFATPESIAAAQATLSAANETYTGAKSAIEPALKNYTKAASELATLKGKTAALRIPLELLKAQQTQLTKDLATWTALVLTETVPAWCADLTEDASGEVATVEIPGENKLVLIAPAAPAPTATDGLLTAREVQSPEQVFWNAAVLPGWQKWKPTYRRGTITAIDYDADTASVTLFEDVSSARNLPINQSANLTAVPVDYMQCDAEAFAVGDVVVVKFTGQDWASPRVIGFCDNPKACLPKFVYVPIEGSKARNTVSTRPFITSYDWDAVLGYYVHVSGYSATVKVVEETHTIVTGAGNIGDYVLSDYEIVLPPTVLGVYTYEVFSGTVGNTGDSAATAMVPSASPTISPMIFNYWDGLIEIRTKTSRPFAEQTMAYPWVGYPPYPTITAPAYVDGTTESTVIEFLPLLEFFGATVPETLVLVHKSKSHVYRISGTQEASLVYQIE